MALIKCPECGREVSDTAPTCPNCGFALRQQAPFHSQTGYVNAAPKKKKNPVIMILVIVGICFLLFICLISAVISGLSSDEKKNTETVKQNNASSTENTSASNKGNEDILKSGKKKYDSGKYYFITNEDLSTYISNLEGVKVYVVTEYSKMNDTAIQANITGGFMYSEFDTGKRASDYSSILNDGDKIAILGTVKGSDDYITGKSIKLENCYVFAIGDDTEQYIKKKSDKKLKKYLKVTEEVANDGADISEDEYKDLCKTLDYEKILRDSDSYKDKYCKVSGTVDQIVEGWFGSFTIYVADSDGNKWGCTYSYKDGEEHLLEGDSVTLYGKCKGTVNVDTIMGKQVTLPEVDIEYIK